MNETLFYIAVSVGPMSTLIVVMVGVLLNNSRLASVEANLSKRIDDMRDLLRAEIKVVDTKLDERTKIIIEKIEELDSCLTRMEGRG